jgi:preprotein translocase subunit SecD
VDDDRRPDPTVRVLEDFVRRVSDEVLVPPFTPGTRRLGSGPRGAGRRRVLAGVLVSLVVVGAVAVAVVYGPRSSGNRPAAVGGSSRAVATFVPVGSSVPGRQLEDDASRLTRRLHDDGDAAATALVRGHRVVVVGGTGLPVPATELIASGTVQFRPALCASAPYTLTTPTSSTTATASTTTGTGGGSLPSTCSAPVYFLRTPNLEVATPTGTSNISSIPLDPVLAGYRSSTPAYDDSHPDNPVLIPLVGGGGERYLLGASGMDGSAVASASAAFQSPEWVVNVTLTGSGAATWDDLAQANFHEIIGIDLDGRVLSAPLIEPSQSTFTSFDGRLQISGDFTERSARELAAVLNSGPLAAPLRPAP